MSEAAIELKADGSASLFYRWRQYRRELGNDSEPRWLKRTSRGLRPVSRSRARRLEQIFQNPELAKPILRSARLESELMPGQPVFCTAFGLGVIAVIEGDNITVKFGEKERQVAAQDLVTLVRAVVDWHTYWLRGADRRFEEGKRLWVVKSLCQFGEWQAFLDRYDYPRNTADDLIRRYKNEDTQLPGNRAIQAADPRPARERTYTRFRRRRARGVG